MATERNIPNQTEAKDALPIPIRIARARERIPCVNYEYFADGNGRAFEEYLFLHIMPHLRQRRIDNNTKQLAPEEEQAFITQAREFADEYQLFAEADLMTQQLVSELFSSSTTLETFVAGCHMAIAVNTAQARYSAKEDNFDELLAVAYVGIVGAAKIITYQEGTPFSHYAKIRAVGAVKDFSRSTAKTADRTTSLDEMPRELTQQGRLGEPEPEYLRKELREGIQEALENLQSQEQLNPRDLAMIKAFLGNPDITIQDLGTPFGLTKATTSRAWARILSQLGIELQTFDNATIIDAVSFDEIAQATHPTLFDYLQERDALSIFAFLSDRGYVPQKYLPEALTLEDKKLERFALEIRLLDRMDQLTLGDKLAFFLVAQRQHIIEGYQQTKNQTLSETTATQIVCDNFGVTPFLYNDLQRMVSTRFPERFPRFMRWATKMNHLHQQGRDISELEEILTEYRYWVYETVTNPALQRLMWKDLALQMPVELRREGVTPVEAGTKMLQTAIILENHGLLDETSRGRLALRNAAMYQAISEFALRPENRDRRITHKELAALLDLFKVKTVVDVLKRMREAGIPIPSNIGEQGRPQEEVDQQLAIAQGVIDQLTAANNGKAPTAQEIQAELDARGRADIRYGLLTSGDYRKDIARESLAHIQEALSVLATADTPEARAKVTIPQIIDYLEEQGVVMSYAQIRAYYVRYRDELRVGQKRAEITPELEAEMRRLSQQEGLSSYQIAERLGISPAAVQNRLKKLTRLS